MKHYYYSENNQQFGPFTLEEIKAKRPKRTTLVWTDGMSNWEKAENIEELKDVAISVPPPLPPQPSKIQTYFDSKYDLSYPRETNATWSGIAIFILNIVSITLADLRIIQMSERSNEFLVVSFISLILRILVVIWVGNIARRLNRTRWWKLLAFFVPSLTLIVIGLLRKLKDKNEPIVYTTPKTGVKKVSEVVQNKTVAQVVISNAKSKVNLTENEVKEQLKRQKRVIVNPTVVEKFEFKTILSGLYVGSKRVILELTPSGIVFMITDEYSKVHVFPIIYSDIKDVELTAQYINIKRFGDTSIMISVSINEKTVAKKFYEKYQNLYRQG